MTPLNLTDNNLLIQAQADCFHSPCPRLAEPKWNIQAEQRAWEQFADEQQRLLETEVEEPEWDDSEAEQECLEYAAALQEAQGIARHEKAFEACEWVKALLNSTHTLLSPLLQACVDELAQRQRNHAGLSCCQERYHRMECWAQWDQQLLEFIRTWIWEQLKAQGFVNEIDAANFSQVVYKTVFSDCWKDIYQFFLRNRESITEAAKHQAAQALSAKLSKAPENTDPSFRFLKKAPFKTVVRDWLLGLELEPQKIDTYFQEGTAHRFSASKIIRALYGSFVASHDLFAEQGIQACDFMEEFIELVGLESLIYDYYDDETCGENLGELDLSLALRGPDTHFKPRTL